MSSIWWFGLIVMMVPGSSVADVTWDVKVGGNVMDSVTHHLGKDQKKIFLPKTPWVCFATAEKSVSLTENGIKGTGYKRKLMCRIPSVEVTALIEVACTKFDGKVALSIQKSSMAVVDKMNRTFGLSLSCRIDGE